jgi:hypothetical protein
MNYLAYILGSFSSAYLIAAFLMHRSHDNGGTRTTATHRA